MSKILVLGLGAIAASWVPGAIGAYYGTKTSIGYSLYDYVIPDLGEESKNSSLDSVWEKLRTKLASTELKDTNIKTKEDLKSWCFNSYKETYWSFLQNARDDLKEKVKTRCTYTIGEELGDQKIEIKKGERDENKSNFEPKITTLQSYKEEELDLDLFIVSLIEDKEIVWKGIGFWCKEAYEKGYQGNNSKRWKLVQTFCKKSQT